MKIGNLNINGFLFSAPLAGISDSIFRRVCRRYGASATFSEMVSVAGLGHSDNKTLKYIKFGEEERPIGIQLFGSDPELVLKGLETALRVQPDFIDFNLGCPVKKVVKQGAGGALLRQPQLATRIMAVLVKNSPIPVTAKLRSGWDSDSIIFPELSRRLQDVGVAAIVIHPRTVIQGFSSRPDRKLVGDTVRFLSIPLIYSGDIWSAEDARKSLDETGASGLMIGRAAMGDPHIFRRIKSYLQDGNLLAEPSPLQKLDMMLDYFHLTIDFYGALKGIKIMRKFIVWYTRGLSGNSQLRQEVFHLDNYDSILSKLSAYRENFTNQKMAKTL